MNFHRILGAIGALSLACVLAPNKAFAIGAPAGTVINNTAEVSYSVGSLNTTAASNQVTLTVAEILDVAVTAQTPDLDVNSGDTQQVLVFLVTNNGNSSEAFRLQLESIIAGDQFDPAQSSPSIYFDTDSSNTLTAADTPYVSGSNDPLLSADGSVRVLVVHDIPGGLDDGDLGIVRLTATALTGSGVAGTVFAGLGNGLANVVVDAIVGTSTAQRDASAQYEITGVTLTAVKSQAVTGGPGNVNLPVPGAIVTYTVVITKTGSGTANNVVFTDNIPANTSYVAGSLRLNNGALTDNADADAGAFEPIGANPARVRVTLPTLGNSAPPQTVTFQVSIN